MSAPAPSTPTVVARPVERQEEVLTDEALAFVAALHRRFTPRRDELLALRAERRAEIARTGRIGFPAATAALREDPAWRVAPAPPALEDRRVEITGPADDRKMTINALNSGARVWLADFEDASSPTWENVIRGQLNLKDAYERRIDFTASGGRTYALRPAEELATVVMRPPRLAPRRAPPHRRRPPRPRRPRRLRPLLLPQRPAAARPRQGAVLLPPQDRVAPGSPAVERRLRLRPGLRRPAAGHGPRHRAHRDRHRRLRDGGDPLRAARPRFRAQRGPLGLPLLHHQELP
ncbi:hypothetical protein GCM10020000_16670 [Streptomyces olivoverticillatus]